MSRRGDKARNPAELERDILSRPPTVNNGPKRRPTPFSKVLAPIVEAVDVEHAEAIREWNAEATKLDPPDGFDDVPTLAPIHVEEIEETTPPVAIDSLPGYQIGRVDGRTEGRLEGATIAVRETRAMFSMANNTPEFIEKMTVFLARRLALLGITLPAPDRIDTLMS